MPTGFAKVCGCVLVVWAVGCGGSDFPTASVEGTLTYNGEAVKGGTLIFVPVAANTAADENENIPKGGAAVVQDDGSFSVSTYGTNDGAVIGKHTVTYSPAPPETASAGSHDEQAPQSPYAGLVLKTPEVEVTADGNTFNLELVKPNQAGAR